MGSKPAWDAYRGQPGAQRALRLCIHLGELSGRLRGRRYHLSLGQHLLGRLLVDYVSGLRGDILHTGLGHHLLGLLHLSLRLLLG